MSRRVPSSQHPLVYRPHADNTDRATTSTAFLTDNSYSKPNDYIHRYRNEDSRNTYKGGGLCNNVIYDTGVTDTDTNSCYNYYRYGHPSTIKKEENAECMFSDSDSSQLPDYEYDQISSNRCSRNYSQRSFNVDNFRRQEAFSSFANRDSKRLHPNERNVQRVTVHPKIVKNTPYQTRLSRFAERPQSSLSSEVTSAIVDGCGGHCQTFENVCYYFLQVAFTMGILIGTSLCIAGAVLRKLAARNLQVLTYIGALLTIVSSLLLAIQCNARCSARKRKKALRNRHTAIPLETLHTKPRDYRGHALLDENGERPVNIQIQIAQTNVHNNVLVEHQGIPWWRRKDLG